MVALAAYLVLLPWSSPTAGATSSALLGVYYGDQGWHMDQVQAMENWQAKKHAVVHVYTDWCTQGHEVEIFLDQQLPNVWNNANVPMVSWQPYLCSTTSTPGDIEVRAARGDYDAYLNDWAVRLKTLLSGPDGTYGTGDDRRVYLRPAHEMNGNWYPWSAAVGNNQPADYVAMWRHVRAIFAAQGLDAAHVQWVWAVNNVDVGGFAAEQFYPGDAYVDWVAVDGYNWGASRTGSTWQSPSQVFRDMVGRLRVLAPAKPLAIAEVGSTTASNAGTSITAKSQWIGDFLAYGLGANVKLISWFNQDQRSDWAMFGGANGNGTFRYGKTTYKAYTAYKSAVGGSGLVASSPANPRLLTDAQFAGQ